MRLFEKGELKILWPFYLQALFGSIFYIYSAFSIPYFIKLGFSLTQIGIILSVLSISIMIFTIPSGALADVIGRKRMLRLGYLLVGIVFFLLFFFKDFYIIILLFFFLGFAQSLQSGKDESWTIDLLKHERKKQLIKDYYNKISAIANLGGIISGIIGAILVQFFGLSILWISTGFAYLSGFFVLSFGKEYFIRKNNLNKRVEAVKNTKKSFKYLLKNKNIFLLVLIAIFTIISSSFSGSNVWSALFTKMGFKDYWFGYLFSAVSFLGIIIPVINKKIVKKIGKEKKFFMVVLFLTALSLISVIFFNYLYILVFLFLIYSSFIFSYNPVRGYFFQSLVPNKIRATITSVNNTFVNLVSALFLPLAGFMADNVGIRETIFIGGIVLIPAIILYSKIKIK